MKRRTFLSTTASASLGAAAGLSGCSGNTDNATQKLKAIDQAYPLAITMWEFS